ncbi:MAG: CheR family methyltransferase [Phycisphaerae bacterium]
MDLIKLSPEQFKRFAKLVYDRTGIDLPEAKQTLLANRLRRRLRALNLASFDDYYKLMCEPAGCEEELPNFLSAVTTNETYFFRNSRLWEMFRKGWIPQFVEQKKGKARTFRLWSAAASSGEEAYTAAIVLRESLPEPNSWQVQIIGTDISKNVLDKAKEGVYNDYAVSQMPREQVLRWFELENGNFRVKDEAKKLVKFQFHNLRESLAQPGFDVVLLRNVLMYFDTPMKQATLKNVQAGVAPGGLLFVGDVDPVRVSSELREAITLEEGPPGVYLRPAAQKVGIGK